MMALSRLSNAGSLCVVQSEAFSRCKMQSSNRPSFLSLPSSSSWPTSGAQARACGVFSFKIRAQEQEQEQEPEQHQRPQQVAFRGVHQEAGGVQEGNSQTREAGGGSGKSRGLLSSSPSPLSLSLLCALSPPAVEVTTGVASGGMQFPVSLNDVLATVATTTVALAQLKLFDQLVRHRVLEKKLSRKLVHVTVGLVFMLFWPLFSASRVSPVLAALAPAGNTVRMLLLGLGIWKDDTLVKAVSREGDRAELLKGPFYYGLAISLVTTVWWRTSPIGIVALVTLCAGDGFADIVGRHFGSGTSARLPYNPSKSYAGSIAMLASSILVSLLYLWLFSSLGYFALTQQLVWGVCAVSLAATAVESLPISTRLDDNLTVPLTSILAGMLVFNS